MVECAADLLRTNQIQLGRLRPLLVPLLVLGIGTSVGVFAQTSVDPVRDRYPLAIFNGITFRDGRAWLPDAPGLGVEVDWKRVEAQA